MPHGMRATSLQHRQEAVDVRGDIGVRIDKRVAYACLRREMDHELRFSARKDGLHRASVRKVAAREGEGRELRKLFQPRLLQRDVVVGVEVVQSNDLSAPLKQAFRDKE